MFDVIDGGNIMAVYSALHSFKDYSEVYQFLTSHVKDQKNLFEYSKIAPDIHKMVQIIVLKLYLKIYTGTEASLQKGLKYHPISVSDFDTESTDLIDIAQSPDTVDLDTLKDYEKKFFGEDDLDDDFRRLFINAMQSLTQQKFVQVKELTDTFRSIDARYMTEPIYYLPPYSYHIDLNKLDDLPDSTKSLIEVFEIEKELRNLLQDISSIKLKLRRSYGDQLIEVIDRHRSDFTGKGILLIPCARKFRTPYGAFVDRWLELIDTKHPESIKYATQFDIHLRREGKMQVLNLANVRLCYPEPFLVVKMGGFEVFRFEIKKRAGKKLNDLLREKNAEACLNSFFDELCSKPKPWSCLGELPFGSKDIFETAQKFHPDFKNHKIGMYFCHFIRVVKKQKTTYQWLLFVDLEKFPYFAPDGLEFSESSEVTTVSGQTKDFFKNVGGKLVGEAGGVLWDNLH
mmetsp:Transcript_10613/g.13305  ORF Transcript_10613/g.13305 Transcript_10613/m.13305 type:complete len:457 (+) Transcript_10613:550-1920(+)